VNAEPAGEEEDPRLSRLSRLRLGFVLGEREHGHQAAHVTRYAWGAWDFQRGRGSRGQGKTQQQRWQ
jgi:hypothetical protein